VVIVHGYDRNAADYARTVAGFAPAADTLVVAPQFLAVEDVRQHQLPDTLLRWQRDAWSGGFPADGPAPSSPFDALDAVLAKLADRTVLPDLATVVLAGFSAGGQLVQRYAIVGKGELAFGAARLQLRLKFLVGSPSSYAYFTDQRGLAEGSLEPFAGAAACPNFNRWKYGFAGELPPYVASVVPLGLAGIERRYAERDVAYLVGGGDDDPDARYLDKSCAAEAQGATRLARMRAYVAMLKIREGKALAHRMWIVGGAAHNTARVFGSPCGRAVLFEDHDCPDAPGPEEKR
jgi:pimeloyl-ACP methyl ester carboxylesterase